MNIVQSDPQITVVVCFFTRKKFYTRIRLKLFFIYNIPVVVPEGAMRLQSSSGTLAPPSREKFESVKTKYAVNEHSSPIPALGILASSALYAYIYPFS